MKYKLGVPCHEPLPASATLADHAECWQKDNNRIVPPRNTPEWETMYAQWIEFAFSKE